MLRNNTDKYKKMYGTSASILSNSSQSMKSNNNSKQLDDIVSKMSLLKQMNPHVTTKKLETLNS